MEGSLSFSICTCATLATISIIFLSSCVSPTTQARSPNASHSERASSVFFQNFLDTPKATEETIAMILNETRSLRVDEPDLTLITFLQKAVKSYGQKKVAKSIYELAQKPLYDLIWMLAGDLDTYLIFDLYNVYSAANSDPAVLSVYDRFRAGSVNRTIVPEVFALDRKYDQFSWYTRVRGRMLTTVEMYIAGKWDISSTATAPPIEYDKDGKVIIAGVRIPDGGSTQRYESKLIKQVTQDPFAAYEIETTDSDEDILEFLNLDT